jgi:hypothetical protein
MRQLETDWGDRNGRNENFTTLVRLEVLKKGTMKRSRRVVKQRFGDCGRNLGKPDYTESHPSKQYHSF